ncbi:LAETG motif-containing sortase-dependent surface protein [Streptomyces sp. ITFR-6]|uniref:LAETG motif-containing sortase-dependent surface protein n=1 Tax=Streptomyces sp. ITFR-6 TaxID=3075197 RepID=UPI00288A5A6E|nr:LAETG motif-containing sortase-dependent surface protein [Streptomyces sp. ITFR-6]WNI30272.1 LAETG motif-containing sortase-dependent surface protein [Streptomyces sp. ITFR-6]
MAQHRRRPPDRRHRPLKDGAHADIKLRLTIDASAPAGNGAAFVSADYTNENGSCGGNPDIAMYDFGVLKAAKPKPGKTDSGTTGTTGTGTTGTTGTGTGTSGGSNPSAQGTASSNPVTTGGSLASTGASSTTPQLALASGAAVALGAAAMFTARRRTGSRV